MALTYTTSDFTAGATTSAADVNSRFDDIKTKFNGGIVDGDISSAAAISVDKLDANYEHMCAVMTVWGNGATKFTFPGSGTHIAIFPIPDDGKGNWVASAAELIVKNCGADDASLRVEWGHYNAGTWSTDATVVSNTTINVDDVSGDGAGGQTLTISTGTLSAGSHRALALISNGAGGGTVIDGTADYLAVSLKLYRKIANG